MEMSRRSICTGLHIRQTIFIKKDKYKDKDKAGLNILWKYLYFRSKFEIFDI